MPVCVCVPRALWSQDTKLRVCVICGGGIQLGGFATVARICTYYDLIWIVSKVLFLENGPHSWVRMVLISRGPSPWTGPRAGAAGRRPME